MEPEQINSTPVTQPTIVEEQTIKPSKLLVYLLFILIILGLASWAGVYLKKESINEVQIVNETDNWKTYRNEVLGIEFKYPSGWKINDENINSYHIISISPSDAVNIFRNGKDLGIDGAISVYVYDDQGLDIDKFVEDSLDLYFISKKDVVVDGINSVEAINGSEYGFSGKHVYIPKNNKVFMIGGGADNMREDVFYKILSTFKFIDKTDISNWKTYNNKDLGISFKYPNDWVAVEWGLLTIDKDYVPNPQRQPHNFTGFCKIVFHDAFSEDSTIQDLIDNNYLLQKPNQTTEMLDNKKGTGFNYMSGLYKFFPLKSEKTLSISLTCGDDVKLKGEEVLNKILSTFKFTN